MLIDDTKNLLHTQSMAFLSIAKVTSGIFHDESYRKYIAVCLTLIEYYMYYGKGQLCFTTHNTSPMSVLRENKKSIDFLSNDNRIIEWHKNGNFSPESLYKNGMIEYLPFNVDATDFVGVLGE